MDLTQLTCFKEVVIAGSVSKAAKNLGISQPAASIRIKQLEKNLNCKLFSKRHRKILLSEAGRIVFNRSIEILESAQNLQQEVNMVNTPARLSGNLRVGCGALLSRHLMPKTASEFLKEHSEVNLFFNESDSVNIPELIAQGRIDLGFGIFFKHQYPTVKFKKIFDDDFVLIASENFVEPENPGDYRNSHKYNYIYSQENTIINLLLKKYLNDFKGKIILRARNSETVTEFVRHNLGISFIPRYLVNLAGKENLKIIELENTPRVQFGVYLRESESNAPLSTEFIKEVIAADEIAKLIVHT